MKSGFARRSPADIHDIHQLNGSTPFNWRNLFVPMLSIGQTHRFIHFLWLYVGSSTFIYVYFFHPSYEITFKQNHEIMNAIYLAVCQNLVPLVNPKIAGKWMFIPLNMVLIGIDPYPFHNRVSFGEWFLLNMLDWIRSPKNLQLEQHMFTGNMLFMVTVRFLYPC